MNDELRTLLRTVIGSMVNRHILVNRVSGNQFQISMQAPQEELAGMMNFLVSHGMSMDEAVNFIKGVQNDYIASTRASVAKGNIPSNKHSSGEPSATGYVIISIILAVLAVVCFTGVLPLWVLLLGLVIGFGIMFLIWEPRGNDFNKTLSQPARDAEAVEAKLNKMLEIRRESMLAYAMRKNKKGCLTIIIAFAVCFCGVMGVMIANTASATGYHEAIVRYGDPLKMSGSNGSKYAVYDAKKEAYVRADYLPEEYRAESGMDLAGVLVVKTYENKVGTYGSVGDAIQYEMKITLYDCITGENYDSTSVWGSEPPEKITTRSITALTGKNGYGKKPTEEQLRRACLGLIEGHQAAN